MGLWGIEGYVGGDYRSGQREERHGIIVRWEEKEKKRTRSQIKSSR